MRNSGKSDIWVVFAVTFILVMLLFNCWDVILVRQQLDRIEQVVTTRPAEVKKGDNDELPM